MRKFVTTNVKEMEHEREEKEKKREEIETVNTAISPSR